jgi:hypothetical protein
LGQEPHVTLRRVTAKNAVTLARMHDAVDQRGERLKSGALFAKDQEVGGSSPPSCTNAWFQ